MDAPDIDMCRKAFARILRMHRRALDISQEELAYRAGMTSQYVSMLERNVRQPSLTTLFMLSYALEIPLSKLVAQIENETG